MITGPPFYEWLSHNFFVIAAVIGVIAAMGYFVYSSSRKRGRYRQ